MYMYFQNTFVFLFFLPTTTLNCGSFSLKSVLASFLDYSVCNPSVEVDLFVLGNSLAGNSGLLGNSLAVNSGDNKASSLLRLDVADSWEKLHDLRILYSYTSK